MKQTWSYLNHTCKTCGKAFQTRYDPKFATEQDVEEFQQADTCWSCLEARGKEVTG